MNPPAAAAVFSFDEKTQYQAMDRTQPSLPMVPGRAPAMAHDYKRNGSTDLFAAMNLATGQVLIHYYKGHTAKDVLAFFKKMDASVPKGLAVHVVPDNLSAHKAPEITKWLGHRDRRRWHLYFTPTSSSWVNLIERWFKELTTDAYASESSPTCPNSSRPSRPGAHTGTTTPNRSSGTPPPSRSSSKSREAVPPSTARSIQRRSTVRSSGPCG
jgi:transposase